MYWSYPNFPSNSLICLTSLVGWFNCMKTDVSDVLYHFGFFQLSWFWCSGWLIKFFILTFSYFALEVPSYPNLFKLPMMHWGHTSGTGGMMEATQSKNKMDGLSGVSQMDSGNLTAVSDVFVHIDVQCFFGTFWWLVYIVYIYHTR